MTPRFQNMQTSTRRILCLAENSPLHNDPPASFAFLASACVNWVASTTPSPGTQIPPCTHGQRRQAQPQGSLSRPAIYATSTVGRRGGVLASPTRVAIVVILSPGRCVTRACITGQNTFKPLIARVFSDSTLKAST